MHTSIFVIAGGKETPTGEISGQTFRTIAVNVISSFCSLTGVVSFIFSYIYIYIYICIMSKKRRFLMSGTLIFGYKTNKNSFTHSKLCTY